MSLGSQEAVTKPYSIPHIFQLKKKWFILNIFHQSTLYQSTIAICINQNQPLYEEKLNEVTKSFPSFCMVLWISYCYLFLFCGDWNLNKQSNCKIYVMKAASYKNIRINIIWTTPVTIFIQIGKAVWQWRWNQKTKIFPFISYNLFTVWL